MKTTLFNEEVFYTGERITRVNKEDAAWLVAKALGNARRRSRLCAHPGMEDALHEMLIVHTKDTYVRPHKHLGKSESFHMIEGQLNVVIFSDGGSVQDIIEMGEYASGKYFYYRLPQGFYHTVLPLSEIVVFHEVTSGPFNKEATLFAPWSPTEDDQQGRKVFLTNLTAKMGGL